MHSMKENIEKSSPSLPLGNPDHEKPCWYWDKEDLARTPSCLEGLEPATEARYRREGARFIFDVGNRLGLPYNTLATGIIYFHRFYMFNSFKQFPRHMTGACCLFLAGKVEETPKRCSDIIKTSRSLLTDIQFRQFGDDPKKEVIVMEKIILQTIKFDLQVEHPYKFLLKYAKNLKGDKKKIQKLVQTAWTFINDSLSTTLSLQWEPEIIAVAVMYLAGRMRKCEIQELTSKPKDKIWWEEFVEDLEVDLIEDICHQILDLYSPEKHQMPHHPPALLQTQQKNQEKSQQPSLKMQQASLTVKPEKNTIMPTNPPQPMKRPATTSSKGENKSCEVAEKSITGPVPKNTSTVYPKENSTPAKMLKLSPAHQPMLPVHPPTKCKSPLVTTVPVGADHIGDAGEISEIQIPRLSQYGPVDQPLSFALCPPPHPTNNDISKMPIANTCLSDKEYQSLQSMPTIDGPFYGPLPLSYTPFHQNLLYPPHMYLAYPPPPGPPYSIFWPPNIPPPNLGYPPPPTYNIHLPPPGMPPTHVVAQHLTSETPVVLSGGQPQVPSLVPPTDMPPLGGMGCSAWM